MAKLTYRKVSPLFWTGSTGRSLREAGPEVRLMALYLLTGPHSHMCGIYHLPIAYLANDLRRTFEGASKDLQKCVDMGFCAYDSDVEVVWVINMMRMQIGESVPSGDNRIKYIYKHLDNLPYTPLIRNFVDTYSQSHNLQMKGLTKDLPKDLSKPVTEYSTSSTPPYPPLGESCAPTLFEPSGTSPKTSGVSPKQKKPKRDIDKTGSYSDDFLAFWEAYPVKKGKGKAWEHYQKKIDYGLPPIDELIKIIEKHKRSYDWTRENGLYIPMPATFLNQRRWEDEASPNKSSHRDDERKPLRLEDL